MRAPPPFSYETLTHTANVVYIQYMYVLLMPLARSETQQKFLFEISFSSQSVFIRRQSISTLRSREPFSATTFFLLSAVWKKVIQFLHSFFSK